MFIEDYYTLKFFYTHAQSPSVGIFTVYRDATGGETITTTAQDLSWDTSVSQNPEIPINAGNTSFDASIGGHYLVMYSVALQSTGGSNRSEAHSWLRINGVSDSQYGYASSYIRRNSNDFEGYHEGMAVLELNPGDDISVAIQKTDSNSATEIRSANRSGINILKLDDTWDYARLRPSTTQAIPTSWTDINLQSIDELDSDGYSATSNSITLKETGKYLVTYNAGVSINNVIRTNDEFRLTLDGSEIDNTRSTAYTRGDQGTQNGIASYAGIIETTAVDQILTLQMIRESSLEGTDHNIDPNTTGITITKLPDGADYLRIGEAGGGQGSTTALNTPISFDTTIEEDASFSHNSTQNSDIDILSNGDYLFFHSLYNRRTGTANGPRENPYLEWQVGSTTLDYGISGSYNRQSNDSVGITNSSSSSAGIIIPGLSSGNVVRLTETNEATDGALTYQAERIGIQGVNIASLFSGNPYLAQSQYRWRDNNYDLSVNNGWLASENIGIQDIGKGEIIRLRISVENGSTNTYSSGSQFQLQWQEKTNGTCGITSWTNISDTNDDWEMVDTIHISPNGENSNQFFLSNAGGFTQIVSEGYHATNGITDFVSNNTFIGESKIEYEFSIQATPYATSGKEYCFRLYNSGESKTLDSYVYPQIQLGGVGVYLDAIWGEAGVISAPANGAWTTLSYTGGSYSNPVIVGRSNTHNDTSEALVFEARNITSTGAEVRLCDSHGANSDGCQTHGIEDIGYIIVDADQVGSISGIEAGNFTVGGAYDSGGAVVTNYSDTYSTTPYVFTSVQSNNGNSPVVTRVSNSTLTGFTSGLCEQEGGEDTCNATHPNETLGWIAVDPTINPFIIDMDIGTGTTNSPTDIWSSASFGTNFSSTPAVISSTVTVAGTQDVIIDEIQNVTTSSMQFRGCELDNDDDCDTHNTETIRWLAVEKGVFAQEYFLDETHYRWYENIDALTPTIPLENENTILRSIPGNDQLRLRILIKNAQNTISSGSLALKLQYSNTGSCSSANSWTDVGNVGGPQDFVMYNNPSISDGSTIPSSLLGGGGHSLQAYSESLATVGNPNNINSESWSEWDFSLEKNIAATTIQYCFRVVTADDDEIEYSTYIQIDTTDSISPTISSHSPDDDVLYPVGNFDVSYNYSDNESGIDTTNYLLMIQRWNGVSWDTDTSDSYESIDTITSTGASFTIRDLPYGRYLLSFDIYDIAGNFDRITHELYVDAIEFTISQASHSIGNISESGVLYDSDDELIVTVQTVGAGFSIFMQENTALTAGAETMDNWDGSQGYGYKTPPYSGNPTSSATQQTLGSEVKNLHPDGEKYSYEYRVKFSALLAELLNQAAGNYEANYSFGIELDYE